jgi:hypothetical protein
MTFETQRVSLGVAASGRANRRAALFRERLPDMAERWALGLAWALMPSRIAGVPNLLRLCLREFLALPDSERTLDAPAGLAGIVHDFNMPTLLAAYRCGLYPFAHVGPLKWWSPPARQFRHRVAVFARTEHLEDRLHRAQLASCALGLRLQRRQADDADLPRHGLPRNPVRRIPVAPGAGRTFARTAGPLADRGGDGGGG